MAHSCPVCGHRGPRPVASLHGVPVLCNQLFHDAASARAAPMGDIDLAICPRCAMIWNSAFDPARMTYAPGYENALHHSPTFRDFAEALTADLIARHDLSGKTVLEIGCGDGFLLDRCIDGGMGRAVGVDPSMRGRRTVFSQTDGVEIVAEDFTEGHLNQSFDLLVCRHVLEHIADPLAFLRTIRRGLGDRTVPVYFEVPNSGWILSAPSPWDVIYEHVSYFTAPALAALFRRAGFAPLSLRTGYDAQFLMIEAIPAKAETTPPTDTELATALTEADEFGSVQQAELTRWRHQMASQTGPTVIWGAGSKGITFANAMRGGIAAFVDLNPRKQGRFVPGVGLPVLSVDQVSAINPGQILIANGLYADEIETMARQAGLLPVFKVISA